MCETFSRSRWTDLVQDVLKMMTEHKSLTFNCQISLYECHVFEMDTSAILFNTVKFFEHYS